MADNERYFAIMSGPVSKETRFQLYFTTAAPTAAELTHLIRQLEITRDFLAEDDRAALSQTEGE